MSIKIKKVCYMIFIIGLSLYFAGMVLARAGTYPLSTYDAQSLSAGDCGVCKPVTTGVCVTNSGCESQSEPNCPGYWHYVNEDSSRKEYYCDKTTSEECVAYIKPDQEEYQPCATKTECQYDDGVCKSLEYWYPVKNAMGCH